jgi:hypothetical protein
MKTMIKIAKAAPLKQKPVGKIFSSELNLLLCVSSISILPEGSSVF